MGRTSNKAGSRKRRKKKTKQESGSSDAPSAGVRWAPEVARLIDEVKGKASASASKRQRTSDDGEQRHQGSAGNDLAAVRERYLRAVPYPHCVFGADRKVEGFGVFDDALLGDARERGLENLEFRLKETDIFRLRQCGDLINVEGLPPEQRELLQPLRAIREGLYSEDFRAVISRICGCGPLSGKQVDLALTAYLPGDHLLCHDDVMSGRRVSFIMYLQPKDWKPMRGGSLEFYPLRQSDDDSRSSSGGDDDDDRGSGEAGAAMDPTPSPAFVFSPQWNTLGFWQVMPGESYHAVQEVFECGVDGWDVARLSLQGWYHAALPGEPGYGSSEWQEADEMYKRLEEKSTLQQLEAGSAQRPVSAVDGGAFVAPIRRGDGSLASSDREFLSQVINPDYLEDGALDQLRQKLFVHSDRGRSFVSVKLGSFLRPQALLALQRSFAVSEDDLRHALDEKVVDANKNEVHFPAPRGYYESGASESWRLMGAPQRERVLVLGSITDGGANPHDELGAQVGLLRSVMQSNSFLRWIQRIFTVQGATQPPLVAEGSRTVARRFRPGLDYTLAGHPDADFVASDDLGDARCDSMLDATFCLVKSEDDVPRDRRARTTAWSDGEAGGYVCYMPQKAAVGGQDDDPAVFIHEQRAQMDEAEATESHFARNNVLTLALRPRKKRVLNFVKFVCDSAPSSRVDVRTQIALSRS